MSNEFPGFEKSAPTNLPTTKGQPTSSWDLDLSPFEKLLEKSQQNTKQLIDAFSGKLDVLTEKISEDRQHEQDKWTALLETFQEYVKSNSENNRILVEKLNSIQQISTNIQKNCEEICNSIKTIEKSPSNPFTNKQDILFWGVIIVSLVFFVLYFIIPRYMG